MDVTAQIHAPPQISTNSAPIGVRRSRQEDQNVTALPVQANGQKTANPCEISVIPNTPEQKRPRQSTQSEDTEFWNEHFAQAWDGCDMNAPSNVDQEKNLNQPTDTVENVADSDDDADKLPSNQE